MTSTYERVLVSVGNDFTPTDEARVWLKKLLTGAQTKTVIIRKDRRADSFVADVVQALGLTLERYVADWKEIGKEAGRRRNREMAANADLCVIFPGGLGTLDVTRQVDERGLMIITYEEKMK